MTIHDAAAFPKKLASMIADAIKFWIWTLIDGVFLAFQVLFIYLESLIWWIFPKQLKSLEGEVILVIKHTQCYVPKSLIQNKMELNLNVQITGAGNGIGKDVALQLANSKAKLVCWDVLKRDNEETVEVLRCLGANAYAYEVDVSERNQVDEAAERVIR